MKKQMADYASNYSVKRRPVRIAPHNVKTWGKLKEEPSRHGTVSFERLTELCKDHQHDTKFAKHPYQFVTYCIRQGWLERAHD